MTALRTDVLAGNNASTEVTAAITALNTLSTSLGTNVSPLVTAQLNLLNTTLTVLAIEIGNMQL